MADTEEVDPLDKLVASLDWTRCVKSILTAGRDVCDIATHFDLSTRLVNRYPNPTLEGKRTQFITCLLSALDDSGKDEVAARVRRRLGDARLIEGCFHELLKTLPKTAPGKLPPDRHAWALLDRLDRQNSQAELDIIRAVRSRREVFDPLSLMVEDASKTGSYAPDAMLSQLSSITASSVVMLAIQNGWITDGYVVLPKRPQVTEQDVFAVGITQYLGNSWSTLEHLEKRWRFFGAKVSKTRTTLTGSDSSVRELDCISIVPEYNAVDIADHVATERLNRYIIQNLEDLAFTSTVDRRLAGTERPVATAPQQYLSQEEAFAAVALSSLLHFNVLEDDTKYAGLSFAEWLRGYAWLQAREPRASRGVLDLSAAAAAQELADLGFSTESTRCLLGALSLNATGGDLFDSPLIRVEGDRFAYHPALTRTLNIPRVILSRLSSLSVQIKGKGKAFEGAVVQLLNENGLHAKSFTLWRDGQEYQFDAVALWGDFLFVIEDKSYSLPVGDPCSLYWFSAKRAAAVEQVDRLTKAVERYPQDVREALGLKPETSWKKVIPCVLYSLPWSLGLVDSTYILDYSSLGRFFESPTLYVKMPIEMGRARLLWRHHLKSFWTGTRPTAQQFLDAMEAPWQLKSLSTTFSIQRGELMLSDRLVLDAALVRRAPSERGAMLAAAGASDVGAELDSIRKGVASLRSELARKKTRAQAKRSKRKQKAKRVRRRKRRGGR